MGTAGDWLYQFKSPHRAWQPAARYADAFADVDVQLKQRHDLIPNLVETVKGYAAHENKTFENVTEARAQVGRAQGQGTAERARTSVTRSVRYALKRGWLSAEG